MGHMNGLPPITRFLNVACWTGSSLAYSIIQPLEENATGHPLIVLSTVRSAPGFKVREYLRLRTGSAAITAISQSSRSKKRVGGSVVRVLLRK